MVRKVVEYFDFREGSLAAHIERCKALLEEHPAAYLDFVVCDDAWHLYETEEDAIEDGLEYRRNQIKARLEWAEQGVAKLKAELKATYRDGGS